MYLYTQNPCFYFGLLRKIFITGSKTDKKYVSLIMFMAVGMKLLTDILNIFDKNETMEVNENNVCSMKWEISTQTLFPFSFFYSFNRTLKFPYV